MELEKAKYVGKLEKFVEGIDAFIPLVEAAGEPRVQCLKDVRQVLTTIKVLIEESTDSYIISFLGCVSTALMIGPETTHKLAEALVANSEALDALNKIKREVINKTEEVLMSTMDIKGKC